jgi:transcriptional regulator GlxA family with amidase domain
MAPLAFLLELRFTGPPSHTGTNAPLVVIAEDVGYQSITAFSRAYHRDSALLQERIEGDVGVDHARHRTGGSQP